MWQHTLLIVAAFFLVLLNGFFVAAEFAIVKVRATQITELANQGRWRARVAEGIVQHLDAYLCATQLGITFASLGLGWIGEPTVAHMLQPVFGWFGMESTAAIHGTHQHNLSSGNIAPRGVDNRDELIRTHLDFWQLQL